MRSALAIRRQIDDLRQDLDSGGEIREILEKEKPEDAAELVRLMADLAMSLTANIANFFGEWNFEEDCRRGREKEAAGAEVRA